MALLRSNVCKLSPKKKGQWATISTRGRLITFRPGFFCFLRPGRASEAPSTTSKPREIGPPLSLDCHSLCNRPFEAVGARKNGREKGRHATPGSRCVICEKFWQKTTDLAQTKSAAKKPCAFYPRSKYICYKDQVGYLHYSAMEQ